VKRLEQAEKPWPVRLMVLEAFGLGFGLEEFLGDIRGMVLMLDFPGRLVILFSSLALPLGAPYSRSNRRAYENHMTVRLIEKEGDVEGPIH
jgi:hypothetical protein